MFLPDVNETYFCAHQEAAITLHCACVITAAQFFGRVINKYVGAYIGGGTESALIFMCFRRDSKTHNGNIALLSFWWVYRTLNDKIILNEMTNTQVLN